MLWGNLSREHVCALSLVAVKGHLAVYAVVCAHLVLINAVTSKHWWAQWTIFGWGERRRGYFGRGYLGSAGTGRVGGSKGRA